MQPTQAMPPGTDPTAVMGKRIGSFLIDVLIGVALSVALFFATVDFLEYDEATAPLFVRAACHGDEFGRQTGAHLCIDLGDRLWYAEGADAGGVQLLSWAYSIGIFIVWQGLAGKTPGKVLMGVRTVNAQGQPPGMLKAFLRQILWFVDLFPYCIPGLTGYLVANSDKNHQRVGDKVASTYVIDKAYMGQPVGQAQPSTGWGTPVAGAPMPGMAGMPPSPTIPGPPPTGAPPATPPPTAAAPAAPASDPTQPQWDAARNAYIAWDASAQVWKQFDDASQEWRPI